jgi:hypothetical protein
MQSSRETMLRLLQRRSEVQPGLPMFSLVIENVVEEDFLKRGDISVLDNAPPVIPYSARGLAL